MGNIIEVFENGRTACRYEYDALGRLTREDNVAFGKTTTWTYDNNGNILARYEYELTAKPTSELHLLNSTCINYAYDDNSDMLLSYGDETFVYDTIGNPTTYRGKTATWAYGRQLTAYDDNTFSYDARGRRTGKNNITFTYDSNGNLIKQSNGLEFLYDHSGVFAVKYNNATYFYRKDAQANIVELLDSNGTAVVKYNYDAWGKCKVLNANGTEITDKDHIGVLNPFRYRSYYLDTEPGLYFLKTRYYDPEIGRFMTIDDISYLDPDSINGLNLYAYCGNNPVNRVDYTGTIALTTILIAMGIGALIGGLVSGGFAIGGQIYQNGWNPMLWDWKQIGLSALGGAVAGAISAIPIPGSSFISYGLTFLAGGTASVLGGMISGSIQDIESGVIAFFLGGAANVLGKGISDLIQHFKVNKIVSNISNKAQSIANMGSKQKSLTIWNMIGLDNFTRNSYKSWGYDQIFNLLMTEASNQLQIIHIKNLTRYFVYSSTTSSLLSGWY